MKSIRLITLVVFISFVQTSLSQNLEKLKENNGFREIKLGFDIKDYPEFVKKDSTNLKYFGAVGSDYNYIFDQVIKDGYDKIGDADIYRIFAKTFKGKIFKINITLKKDYGTIKMLKLVFGKPSFENMELGMLRWTTDNNIECEFMGYIEFFKNDYIRFTEIGIEKLHEKNKKENEKKKAISQF